MRTLEITAKCSDLCFTTFKNGDKEYEQDGYPLDIPGLCEGDYVHLTVDLDTGKLIGFISPTTEDILQQLKNEDDEDEDNEDGTIYRNGILVERESDIININIDPSLNIPSEWIRTSKKRWK